jgi:hypothetical protein
MALLFILTVQNHFASVNLTQDIDNAIKGGDVIRLFHQEFEGFVRADHSKLIGRDDYEVFLKLTKNGKNKTRNTNTMWQVELQDSVKGNPMEISYLTNRW